MKDIKKIKKLDDSDGKWAIDMAENLSISDERAFLAIVGGKINEVVETLNKVIDKLNSLTNEKR